VWNYAKREIGKTSIRSKNEMEKVILAIMVVIQEKTDLVKSFFYTSGTKYAAATD